MVALQELYARHEVWFVKSSVIICATMDIVLTILGIPFVVMVMVITQTF